MFKRDDITAIAYLIRRFALRYWAVGVGLIFFSLVAGLVVACQPLVLAPGVQLMEKTPQLPADHLRDLTLNNLGPTLLKVAGMERVGRLGLIITVAISYVVLSILVAVLNFLTYVTAIWIRTTISRDMSVSLQKHMLGLPLSFFNGQKAGDLISRFTNDVTGTAYFLDSVSRGLLQSIVTISVCAFFLIKTDVTLAAASVGVGLAHFTITRLLTKQVRENINEQNVAVGGLSASLQEAFLNIRTVKSFAAEAHELKRFEYEAETVRRRMMRYTFFKHFEEPLRLVANAVAIALVLVLSFRAFDKGSLTVSGFAMFLAITQRVIDPISQFFTHLLATSGMLGCAARVLAIFNTQNSIRDGNNQVTGFHQSISLKHVAFGYIPERPVLNDISLDIAKGEMVAIVGPSGVGKSALADLILRLYDPVSGTVSLDGVSIREFTQASYRRLFGVVPQECLLFNVSVRDNIVFGREYSDEKLERALYLSSAKDFVEQMTQGLDTVVGDRGVRLSGGQRQRIAIARAIYDEPPVLVLDEATSALDTESERAVQTAVNRVVKEMTAIVIAHRLSTVIHANRIVVLKDGAIESAGSHEQLLKTSDTYRDLYEHQFDRRSPDNREEACAADMERMTE